MPVDLERHFNQLQERLEKGTLKDYIFIIDYLINFLGCIVLSSFNTKSLQNLFSSLFPKINFSRLTAGEWVEVIEKALERNENRNNKLLVEIEKNFCSKHQSKSIRENIKRWIELRNLFSHEIILPEDDLIEKECSKRILNIRIEYSNFVNGLIKIAKTYNIIKEPFFKFKDNALYIYSGMDGDKVKFRHYSKPSIKMEDTNIPFKSKEIKLSLEKTKNDLLWGLDSIIITVQTYYPKLYKNDLYIYINNNLIGLLEAVEYTDGDDIFINTNKLSDNGINFNDSNELLIKALRNGKIQDEIKKYIKIYNIPPEPTIKWKDSIKKEINIPIRKREEKTILINSVFDISNVSIIVSDGFWEMVFKFPNRNKQFSFPIPLFSSKPTVRKIDITIKYKDAIGLDRETVEQLYVNFYPNFFKPEFVGEERLKLIDEIINNINSQNIILVTGEGGTGKTRLIEELLNKINRRPSIEISLNKVDKLVKILAHHLKIFPDTKSSRRYNVEVEKISEWIDLNKDSEQIWLIKDCHEASNDDIDFLLNLCRRIQQTKIILILESRDASWNDTAKEIIDKLRMENVYIVSLQRLKDEDLMKIIDSVFFENNFPQEIKEQIIKISDGIIYLLLQCLKNLYDKGFIEFTHDTTSFWSIKPGFSVKEIAGSIPEQIMKFGIEPVLEELDRHNYIYGLKARDLLRYLYFCPLTFSEINELLNLPSSECAFILEKLEKAFIVVRDIYNDFTEVEIFRYHHQLKRDYCKERYMPPEMECDYFFTVLIQRPTVLREREKKRFLKAIKLVKLEDDEDDTDKTQKYIQNNISKCIENKSVYRLKEPYLKEKISYLLEQCYCNPEYKNLDPILLIKLYIDLFQNEIEFLGYLCYILNPDCPEALEHSRTVFNLEKSEIEDYIKNIESLIEYKNIDKNSPYYYKFLAVFEYWKLFADLWIKMPTNLKDKYPFWIEEGVVNLSQLLFLITNILKRDLDLLKECYRRLEEIQLYDKLSNKVDLYHYSFDHSIICDISLMHVTAMLALLDTANANKYISEYKTYIKYCYDEEALIIHFESLISAGLNESDIFKEIVAIVRNQLWEIENKYSTD